MSDKTLPEKCADLCEGCALAPDSQSFKFPHVVEGTKYGHRIAPAPGAPEAFFECKALDLLTKPS